MADKDRQDAEGPSLEMPSLGSMLRRRKGRPDETDGPVSTPEPVTPAAEAPATEPAPAAAPTTVETVASAEQPPAPDAPEPEDAGEGGPEAGARRARRSRSFTLPAVDGRVAAAITGVVVGLLAVGLTYLGLLGCEGLNGTQSCGGPGLFMLVLILALLVAAGTLLLKAWRIRDALSTSLLGVGLVTVICLLFLIGVLFSPWMFVVIPLVAGATFTLAHWVTATYGGPAARDA
jgi:hypothetical protein